MELQTGRLGSTQGHDVNKKICKKIKELFKKQGVSVDPKKIGMCSFFDKEVWQRPLLDDATVGARMRANKYVALADILAPEIVDALQLYYHNIIKTEYKVFFFCCCVPVLCVYAFRLSLYG